jgi:predicted phosphoribosyltransferase
MLRFSDRREAGRLLAAVLGEYAGRETVTIMPVRTRALEVAEGLSALLGVRCAPFDALASLSGTTTMLVDDGFDSVDRMREAVLVARGADSVRIVAAAPVGTPEVCQRITGMVDHCVCLAMPTPFHSVAFWYDDSFRAAAKAVFAGRSHLPRRRAVSEAAGGTG